MEFNRHFKVAKLILLVVLKVNYKSKAIYVWSPSSLVNQYGNID